MSDQPQLSPTEHRIQQYRAIHDAYRTVGNVYRMNDVHTNTQERQAGYTERLVSEALDTMPSSTADKAVWSNAYLRLEYNITNAFQAIREQQEATRRDNINPLILDAGDQRIRRLGELLAEEVLPSIRAIQKKLTARQAIPDAKGADDKVLFDRQSREVALEMLAEMEPTILTLSNVARRFSSRPPLPIGKPRGEDGQATSPG